MGIAIKPVSYTNLGSLGEINTKNGSNEPNPLIKGRRKGEAGWAFSLLDKNKLLKTSEEDHSCL